jgi:hypothetical protein
MNIHMGKHLMALIEVNEEGIHRACDLIYEVLDVNNVPVSVGANACLNIFLHALVMGGATKEKVFEVASFVKEVLESIGGKAEVLREGPHEE